MDSKVLEMGCVVAGESYTDRHSWAQWLKVPVTSADNLRSVSSTQSGRELAPESCPLTYITYNTTKHTQTHTKGSFKNVSLMADTCYCI